MQRPEGSDSGFVLITVILAMSLLCVFGGLLQLELALFTTLVAEAETQMHSQVLAENGIELARMIVASTNPQDLLVGANGLADCVGLPGWRDPISIEAAWRTDLSLVRTDCDDGLAWMLGSTPDQPALGSAEEGWMLLRFSNDPEEIPTEDRNGTILVRSLGVVPTRLRQTARFAGRNSVTMLEARLRRERAFDVETALTLVGRAASLVLGDPDGIAAGSEPPIDVVEFPATGLTADVESAVGSMGGPVRNWYRNITETRMGDAAFRRILERDFWVDLEDRWVRLAGRPNLPESGAGLHFLPEDAALSGELCGLFLVRGDVVVRSGANLTGLVVHLGGGELRIEGNAHISGGLWMAGLAVEGDELAAVPIRLEMEPGARLVYDEQTVQGVLSYLPPTQLTWRIIFPEMG